MASFGDNLKRLRTEKNISQGELADAIGMHSMHISRYERNLASPSIDMVKKIAEKLNLTVDIFVFGTQDEKTKNKIKDQELLNMFSQVQLLDKQDLTCVKALLHAFLFHKETKQRLAQH